MNKQQAAKYQPMVDFIRTYVQDHGYPPTVREMQQGLGLASTSVTNWWMHVLQNAGRITWMEGQSRTVQIVGDDVIHLTGDEAKMVRAVTDDPKGMLMRAIRAFAPTDQDGRPWPFNDEGTGLVPTRPVDGTYGD